MQYMYQYKIIRCIIQFYCKENINLKVIKRYDMKNYENF